MTPKKMVAAACCTVALGWWTAPASAQAVDAGDAVVVEPADTSQPLERGGSATPFTLRLPTDASCPGDSAHDDYRIQTFIVPAADDPATLEFESTKPVGDGRWALYQTDTRPFVQGLTEMNEGPGEPGRIGGLPVFTFAVYPPDLFEDGDYRIGVACTLYGELELFWDTEIVLANDVEDEPGQLRWHVAGAAASTSEATPNRTLALALAGVGAAAAVGAVYLRRSDRTAPSPLPEEQP